MTSYATGQGESDKAGSAANRFILLDDVPRTIDLSAIGNYGWGRDYHLAMLRDLEASGAVSGLTFFISYQTPESLPRYGPDVVVLIIGDEFHLPRPWFSRVRAILRCYGSDPVYADGWPFGRVRRAAAVQYLHKRLVQIKAYVRDLRHHGFAALVKARARTLQLPLGPFREFEAPLRPLGERTINYGFMGSIAPDFAALPLKQRLLDGPKYQSRRQLLGVLDGLDPTRERRGITPDFETSIQNHIDYIATLLDTKIALVPRGVSYESYRFYEAFKAGCVVICEPQPLTWYNRDHPGIVIDDWSRLPGLLTELLGDSERLDALARAGRDYWRDHLSPQAVALVVGDFLKRL